MTLLDFARDEPLDLARDERVKPSLTPTRNASVQGRIGIPLALGILVLSRFAAAVNAQAVARPEQHAERATTPPKLDGVLDDAATLVRCFSGSPRSGLYDTHGSRAIGSCAHGDRVHQPRRPDARVGLRGGAVLSVR